MNLYDANVICNIAKLDGYKHLKMLITYKNIIQYNVNA